MSGDKLESAKIDNDIFAMAGFWEPRSFQPRYKGMWQDNYPYSEEMAGKLSAVGISVVVWHYYKGLGIKTEQKEMRNTAVFFKHLEKFGITRGVYINGGSVFADTFIAENPDFADKIAIDQFGLKHQYSEFYRCFYRWRPCNSNPEFGAYFGMASVKAIKDGAEFILFDNSAQMPCYCDRCTKDFPGYLHQKYPDKPAKGTITYEEMLGHDFKGTAQLPRGTARMPIDNMPAAPHRGGMYDWVRFRQNQYEKSLATACDMIRKASPKARIAWNLSMDDGEFSSLVWGVDVESSWRAGTNYFFSEDTNFAGIEDRRLITHIRTYKYGRALNNRVIVHNLPPGNDDVKFLNYAEAAAFNDGCLGRVMWATDPDDGRLDLIKKSLKFFRANKDVYIGSKCKSRLALYRCSESEVANWADAVLSRLAVEEVLIKNSIQYDYVLSCNFDLANYDVLICANTITVSDEIIGKIAEFVKKGGKVVCTELSFSMDVFGYKRNFSSDMGLKGERDSSVGRKTGQSDVSEILEYLGLDKKYADHIFFLKKLDYSKTYAWDPRSAQLPHIGKEYFAEPHNAGELLNLVTEALGGCDVEIEGPENVTAGYFDCADGGKVVHVFDYKAGREINGIKLRFKLDSRQPNAAKFVTLDSQSDVALQYEGNFASCILPMFKTYGFVKF
ncbi:MAG: beta-galactosidase trimerization domain-containing protein [Planctomycetota bacterium]